MQVKLARGCSALFAEYITLKYVLAAVGFAGEDRQKE